MSRLQIVVLFLIIILSSLIASAKTESGCVNDKVCLKVISQRWMTADERKRFSPFSLRSSAVRLRLSNESNVEIAYLTGLDSVEPMGYRLFRDIAVREWGFLPKTNKRLESLFMQAGMGASKYLRLPQNSALEFELPDWGNPRLDAKDEEHAFSIFIKIGGRGGSDRPTEIISESFSPLKK